MQKLLSLFAIVLLPSAACSTAATQGGSSFAGAGRTGCEAASLALADDAVVGSLNGTPVMVKDLGPELKAVEKKALREYCDTLASARRQALDNHITEKLVEAEAKKTGKTGDEWVREQVMAKVGEPSDAEVQAFYDERKKGAPEGAIPPIEAVKPQIVAILQRDKSEKAIAELVDGLQKTAAVERKLPDIRSAAVEIKTEAHTPVKGKAGGKVRVVEFADFQCPYCSRAADSMRELAAKYGDRVEFSYRHFPLRSIHPQAQRASEFAVCAGEQGKFWELHDALYADQEKLDENSLREASGRVGVDGKKLDDCLGSGRASSAVEADFKAGESIGIEGTPSFYINGRPFLGTPNVQGLSAAIEEQLGS